MIYAGESQCEKHSMYSPSNNKLPALKDISQIASENNPGRVAFGEGVNGDEITWAEFEEQSNRAANAFQQHVAQGDRVAFFCDGSISHVTLWNGALKAGCVVSNLHVKASPETVRYCVDELKPRVLVVDEEYSDFLKERVYSQIETDFDALVTIGEASEDSETSSETFLQGQQATVPDTRVQEDDIAVVIWTSGTTGRPKGWCFTNRALVRRGMKFIGPLKFDRSTRRLQGLTPSFAAWYSGILPAMLVNASTYFMREWDPEIYLQAIEEREITTLTLVPTMWQEMLRLDTLEDYDLSSLKRIATSGERLDATTLQRLRSEVCEQVANGYAATEALGTMILPEELTEERSESVGKPIPGTQIRIVKEGGAPHETKPPNETGEIIIKGGDQPVWAWGDTETTAESFVDGWWYSGDSGYKDEDGYLYLEGRTDFMILSKGIKVYPTPVEECLNDHPGVEEAAVIGVEDEEYGEKVTAVVQLSDSNVTADELDEWCLDSAKLARHERPREYRFIDDSLPRTVTGKLDRKAAQEKY